MLLDWQIQAVIQELRTRLLIGSVTLSDENGLIELLTLGLHCLELDLPDDDESNKSNNNNNNNNKYSQDEKEIKKRHFFASMKKLETRNRQFSLNQGQLQITQVQDQDYTRITIVPDRLHGYFGVQISSHMQNNKLIHKKLTQYTQSEFAALKNILPHTATVAKDLNDCKKPVISFLGGVRQINCTHALMQATKEALELLIDAYGYVGVLTAGHKGTDESGCASTRAPHDATLHFPDNTISMVVGPDIGKEDSHQHPYVCDRYGHTWGDDAPALIGLGNALIVFAPYGLITQLEIDTARSAGKPIAIIDTTVDYDATNPTWREVITKRVQEAINLLKGQLPRNEFNNTETLNEASKKHFLWGLTRQHSDKAFDVTKKEFVPGGAAVYFSNFSGPKNNIISPPRNKTFPLGSSPQRSPYLQQSQNMNYSPLLKRNAGMLEDPLVTPNHVNNNQQGLVESPARGRRIVRQGLYVPVEQNNKGGINNNAQNCRVQENLASKKLKVSDDDDDDDDSSIKVDKSNNNNKKLF